MAVFQKQRVTSKQESATKDVLMEWINFQLMLIQEYHKCSNCWANVLQTHHRFLTQWTRFITAIKGTIEALISW